MERNREADLATLRAVQFEAQRGAHAQAVTLARAAISDGLEHPLLLNVAALGCEEEGRFIDAEQLLRRAVALAPNDIASRNALGLCLLRLDRPEDALSEFEVLIRVNPALAFFHSSKGAALFAIGRIEEAELSFRHSLQQDPSQGVALAGLARIAASRGSYAEARTLAERALVSIPGNPDAILSLAAAELGLRSIAQAESLTRALLAEPNIAPSDRAYAHGLLGDILYAENRPGEAFAAYEACNEALRRLYSERFASAPTALEYANSMATQLASSPVAPRRAGPEPRHPADARADPVFLLGFPRSGTTLIEIVLEGHPDVVSLEEQELLIDGVREFMQRPEDLERLRQASPARLAELRSAYWQRVARRGIDVAGRLFIDEHPFNTLKLPLIACLFPRAKLLFACRDPRDVVLSCFRHRFKMSAPTFELLTLDGAAKYYDATMRIAVQSARVFALEPLLVRHEDVVTEFGREMRRICAFLELEWTPAMGDFALRAEKRSVLTPSTAQLVRGLNTEGIGQWRRYPVAMTPVLEILTPWIKRFLYET
jgi:tetratricopeptide (TPR) repeat protein